MKNMSLKDFLQRELVDISDLEYALNTQVLITITDTNGKILYANEHFLKSLNYSKEEVLGSNHSIFKSGTHSFQFYKKIWKTILENHVWAGAILNKSKNGTLIWFKTKIVPITSDKKITHFISIRTDITENVMTSSMLQVAQKSLKNQNIDLIDEIEQNKIFMKQQRFSVIGELASRMAHDLRNPLSVIKISLENIRFVYGTINNTEKSFERIDNAINRIAHQTEDVLDFVKGRVPKLHNIKLSDIIVESVNSITILDNVELILPKNDVEILADKKLFSIALNNLILNGIQAIEGDGTLEIILDEDDDAITIQIKDSGKGISKENIGKIFEPLFTTKQTGTGLGLASVKSIIESHGGIISVTSPPTIFTITLPKI